MDLTEEKVSSEEIFSGRVVHLVRDTVRLPNGALTTREVVHHPGAVCVVPLTDDGEVVMVRQFRYPFGRVLLEAPAGKLDPGESPLDCARRELSEETGAEAETFEDLGEFYSSVAIFDESIHLFLARGLRFKTAHADDDEFLQVERIPLTELVLDILSDKIRDGKTQAAILKVFCLEQEKRKRAD